MNTIANLILDNIIILLLYYIIIIYITKLIVENKSIIFRKY